MQPNICYEHETHSANKGIIHSASDVWLFFCFLFKISYERECFRSVAQSQDSVLCRISGSLEFQKIPSGLGHTHFRCTS